MKNYRGTPSFNSLSTTAGTLGKHEPAFIKNCLGSAINFLGIVGRYITDYLFENSDVKIVETTDQYGHLIWEVSDRVSGDRHTFFSEAEVRVWLDKRYYL